MAADDFITSLPADVGRIALAALDTPPDERARRFAQLVADHPHYANELSRLLSDAAASTRASPIGAVTGVDDSVPEHIGPYRIERVLGSGGMGIVFAAEQTAPVRRRVALKVVRQRFGGGAILQRFALEHEALARMEHSCIARVLDAGALPDGRPFFAMEFVDGQPITTFSDARRLGLADRLRLFADVCRGVQHAHHKGVIHRDLKPSNILVATEEGRSVPKIIDFGLARATEGQLGEAAFTTEAGAFVGTPAYMSPEQAGADGGDVDARTDVFSLGVVLYELLTGCLPFLDDAKITRDELRRRVCHDDPVRPSARVRAANPPADLVATSRATTPDGLHRQLRGDLDWIVLRALEKDREQRYRTPDEFADDVGRYLGSLPVSAGPPSVWYRWRKFARRHRGVVVASTVAGACVVAGLVASIAFWLRAEEEAVVARDVNAFWSGVLHSADPDNEGRDVKLVRALNVAVRRLDAGVLRRPLLEAGMRWDLGAVYELLGELDGAAVQLDRAVALLKSHDGDRDMLGRVLREAASVHEDLEHYDVAEAAYQEAFDLLIRQFGRDHEETIGAEQDLARVVHRRGDLARAERCFVDVLARSDRKLGPTHRISLTIRENLAVLLRDLGRPAEAESLLRETLAVRQRSEDARTERWTTMSNLGAVLWDQKKIADATPLFEEAWRERVHHLGANHLSTLNVGNSYIAALKDLKRFTEAENLASELTALATKSWSATHDTTLALRCMLGQVLCAAGKHEEAQTLVAAAVADADAKSEIASDVHFALHLTHGEALLGCKSLAEAGQALKRALDLAGGRERDTQRVRVKLRELYQAWGKPEEAAKW